MGDIKITAKSRCSFQDITMEDLVNMGIEFNNNCCSMATDIWDALEGGNFDKGIKAAKELNSIMYAGKIINFYGTNHKVLASIASGGFAPGTDPEFIEKIKSFNTYCNNIASFLPLFEGTRKLMLMLLNKGMDACYTMSLTKLLFEFSGCDDSLRNQISKIFSEFVECRKYFLSLSFNYRSIGYADSTEEEKLKIIYSIFDDRMMKKFPLLCEYADPFRTHCIFGNLAEVRTLDSWSRSYKEVRDKEELIEEASKLCDSLLKITDSFDLTQDPASDKVLIGFGNLYMKLQEAFKMPLEIYQKFKSGSDESPYWIMKYDSAVLSAKSTYNLGSTDDPKDSGTDYFKSFKAMNTSLMEAVTDTIHRMKQ